jgi:hypothetical protein
MCSRNQLAQVPGWPSLLHFVVGVEVAKQQYASLHIGGAASVRTGAIQAAHDRTKAAASRYRLDIVSPHKEPFTQA